MSDYHDILFPMRLARGAIGGPIRRTNIAMRKNGTEVRINNNQNSRRQWQIASKNSTLDDLSEIISFFEARFGRLYAFRFNDPFDNKSCTPSQNPSALDQKIGIGDGTKTQFQLIKNYGDSQNIYSRKITKPVINSVSIAVNGVTKANNSYIIDFQTGNISFNIAPPNGHEIRAGYKFDNIVRFDNEHLELSLDGQSNGHISDIILIEVL